MSFTDITPRAVLRLGSATLRRLQLNFSDVCSVTFNLPIVDTVAQYPRSDTCHVSDNLIIAMFISAHSDLVIGGGSSCNV